MSTGRPGPRGLTGAAGGAGPAGPAGPGLKSFRATGVTDAAGNVVFNMAAAAFAGVPIVATACGPTGVPTDVTEARVTALTAASCTVNVRRSPAVIILGISVLQVPIPASGVQVHLHAFDAGVQA